MWHKILWLYTELFLQNCFLLKGFYTTKKLQTERSQNDPQSVFPQHSVNLFIDPMQFGALFPYTLVSLAPHLFPAFSCVLNHAWWRSINWLSSLGSTICFSFLIFHRMTSFLSCFFPPVKTFEKRTLTHFEGITLHFSEPFSLTAQSHANSDPAGQSPWPLTSLCSSLASVAFHWMALIVCQLRTEAHKSCVCAVYRRHCGVAKETSAKNKSAFFSPYPSLAIFTSWETELWWSLSPSDRPSALW